MAEITELHVCFLRLIIIALSLSCVACESKDNWDRHFLEIKTLISQLDSRVSAVDAKVSGVNLLDYAFKTNTIDNNLQTLNTRVDQITNKMDSIKESVTNQMTSINNQMNIQLDAIKESLKNLPSPECTIQSEARLGAAVDDGVVQKLDDYGKKLLQSQKEMKDSSQVHHNSLSDFVEVVRSGFTKVMSKLDSLLTLEGQMSKLIPSVNQLSVTTNHINDEVKNALLDTTEIKRTISDCHKSKNFSDITKSFSDIVAEVQSSVSFPVSQLGQALEDAKVLQQEMAQLSGVEDNLVKAVSLSSRLLAKESLQSLPQEEREMAQNLKKSLLEIENVTLPLFLSVPYRFENIQAIIGDSFATMANRTQCRSDETVKLEIQRLKESVSEKQVLGRTANCKTDVFGYCSDSIQDLVVREKPDLKVPLQKLISHLKLLADLNEKSQTACQNSDRVLGSLLG